MKKLRSNLLEKSRTGARIRNPIRSPRSTRRDKYDRASQIKSIREIGAQA